LRQFANIKSGSIFLVKHGENMEMAEKNLTAINRKHVEQPRYRFSCLSFNRDFLAALVICLLKQATLSQLSETEIDRCECIDLSYFGSFMQLVLCRKDYAIMPIAVAKIYLNVVAVVSDKSK
jgi:hypothetical protein